MDQQRRLHCGRTIAPSALGSTGAGWDFLVVPLLSDGRIAFSDLDLMPGIWSAHVVGLLSAGDAALFERELSWGRHLSLPALICPVEIAERIEILRQIRAHLLDPLSPPVLVRVPWTSEGWIRWDRVRALAEWDRRLCLCLEASGAPDLDRFLAEPVDCIWFRDAEMDAHAVRSLFAAGTDRAIFEGADPRSTIEVRSLFPAHASFDPKLVPPVQPLRDHLPSGIYAQFERAVPKYQHYYRAICSAFSAKKPAVVAIAGAGRGPLVQAALQAAKEVGHQPKIYAVEKNPNAAITLRTRAAREWRGAVEVIEADMRAWSPPERVDLLISELLGAFGDNELSPECLDGAERWLAEGGISIPRRSTSFVAPAFAPRLVGLPEPPMGIALDRVRLLADARACFVFDHPNPIRDHRRRAELTFTSRLDAWITGLAGFFEAELWDEIIISTRPETETPDMRGWSTLYFPLARPLRVKRDEEIRCAFFREKDPRRVWYEWALLSPELSAIQNARGRSDSMSY